MRARRGLVLAALLVAAACAPPTSRPGEARFVVGEPYAMGGVWSYPREDHALSESGLAVVLPDTRRGRRTANGEVHDPAALVAAHRTLQLPAVLSVWNLGTGREVRVRVNDRGPAERGRVIGLSRRAAELLGVVPGRPARVRIAADPALSRAVSEGLPGSEGPRLAVAAAPVASVEREQLAPLSGTRSGGRGRPDPAGTVSVSTDAFGPARRAPPLERLPEEVAQRGAVQASLVVDAGTFFRRDLAERRATSVGGVVDGSGAGRGTMYRVRLGPFTTVEGADRALDTALGRGIPDAKIVLE